MVAHRSGGINNKHFLPLMIRQSRNILPYFICFTFELQSSLPAIMLRWLSLLLMVFLLSCGKDSKTLFTKLSSDETGITFRNLLQETHAEFNVMQYPYFYNGGGVAVGDINGDGLPDICFTGNMVKNRLYLNKGNFKFEDITEKSGIAANEGWCTGVTMADVNGDGKLDIYICRSGLSDPSFRKNLLFINNGDLTFTEEAARYGIDNAGYSTQASFFDYDKDGDLDLFLINQSSPEYSKGMHEHSQLRLQAADKSLENKLYRNDNGHFTDVTASSGISSNVLTYSLGLSTADINMDGWPDIYIGNDFNEGDYLYINNHDGTFTEQQKKSLDHTSLYSMGCDVADYNNDALPDICELDMLPENNRDLKMHVGADNYDKFKMLFDEGFSYQYMKNSLQKNNGDGTFSEIGQLAGISNTDWSWSALLADFDNDGLKDLFISNGYKRDNTNLEFVKYSMDKSARMQQSGASVTPDKYISKMQGILLNNYIFKNDGNDQFQNKIKDWGLDQPSYSNGAVYADLNNDGDLDLILNNLDEEAGIYKNNSNAITKNHYLRILLQGSSQNKDGFGAKLFVYTKDTTQYYEQLSTRGYQSGITDAIHVGLGNHVRVDSIRIVWPTDETQLLINVRANQNLTLNIANATEKFVYGKPIQQPLFVQDSVLIYTHKENVVNDFARQILLPYFYSHNGPCMATADVNGDGLTDIYIGGSEGNAGALFIQDKTHHFHQSKQSDIAADSASEDTGAAFFDANGDGKPDLYITSGGYDDYNENSPLLADRLYINDGKGNFIKKEDALPQNFASKSCVKPCDIDGDGDIDLFVGGKVIPGKWPQSCKSSIYINDGTGKFTDETNKWNKAISNIGIVTDAVWADMNNDGKKDLVIVGEWMAPTIFENNGKTLVSSVMNQSLADKKGWWNTVVADDFDKDGKVDLCIGNYGLNTQLKASQKEPVQLYATDIDNNGSLDPVLTSYSAGKSYPFAAMDDITAQVPSLRKTFYDYSSYTNATIENIIPAAQLSSVKPLQASVLQTCYFKNTGLGFVQKELPVEAQYSPVYNIQNTDVNKDGYDDLILFGNNAYNRIRLSKQDANHGVVLLNDKKGNFVYATQSQSGLNIRCDVRSSAIITDHLLVGCNNQPVMSYRIKK